MRGSGSTEIVIGADIPVLAVSTVELRSHQTPATQQIPCHNDVSANTVADPRTASQTFRTALPRQMPAWSAISPMGTSSAHPRIEGTEGCTVRSGIRDPMRF
ncbi:hypothetical protein N7471_007703 [Penicillium samsonianum]|uniref:uncharacterized protein n=1 Tax=Penicillium samsonianum TaxID=1882272 RepID=UPI00254964EF|nr:uncharacterized protein N7471_007703 [Penicillium samsonianum]KAJ6132488.1 hypothetical protein N7471_007703 [Penicillium samsonianum]